MFRGARRLKVPLPLPVNNTEENQSFQHSPTFFSAVNWCWEGGFTALLLAGSRARLPPQQQCRASTAVDQGSPSSDSGRDLDQQSPNSGEGPQGDCLAAGTRIWPLSATHEGREPVGEYRLIQIGCELHFILLEWIRR